MTDDRQTPDATLAAADRVVEALAQQGIDTVVIGAIALAFHNHPRATEDLDLAVATEPRSLEPVAAELRGLGWVVELRFPDPADPLGGVLDVRAPGADLVQVVNFHNPPAGGFPRLVREALPRATPLVPDHLLRVVDLESLIAFKLYAGGAKSKLDVLELLDRNPQLDRAALRRRCAELGLGAALARVVRLAEEP